MTEQFSTSSSSTTGNTLAETSTTNGNSLPHTYTANTGTGYYNAATPYAGYWQAQSYANSTSWNGQPYSSTWYDQQFPSLTPSGTSSATTTPTTTASASSISTSSSNAIPSSVPTDASTGNYQQYYNYYSGYYPNYYPYLTANTSTTTTTTNTLTNANSNANANANAGTNTGAATTNASSNINAQQTAAHPWYNYSYNYNAYAAPTTATAATYLPPTTAPPPRPPPPEYVSVKPSFGIQAFHINAPKKIPQLQVKSEPITPSPAPTTAKSTPVQWPESLKKYVERSFSQCVDDSDRNFVEQYLKKLITNAIKQTPASQTVSPSQLPNDQTIDIWKTDWDNMPLPHMQPKLPQKRKIVESGGVVGADVEKRRQREKRFGAGLGFAPAATLPAAIPGATLASSGAHNYSYANTNLSSSPMRIVSKRSWVSNPPSSFEEKELDWDQYTIKGTSQELEKSYLRLTSAPDPSTVRPENILKQSYALVLSKWHSAHDYDFFCEQFKSIRQDLTVQRIKNEFTVEVYETHAKIALQNGDIGEFNQCQTQLQSLYSEGIKGNSLEFTSYRLLYFVYQNNMSDIGKLLGELPGGLLCKDSFISHALAVRESVALGNWHKFFKLYQNPPENSVASFMMDNFLNGIRLSALQQIAKGLRPEVPVTWIASELVFDDVHSCVAFLEEHNVVLTPSKTDMDTKLSTNIT